MDAQQQARANEITALLRDAMSPGKALPLEERTALRNELAGIYAGDAAPRPAVDAGTAALAARADMLSKALYSHRWSPPDQRIISGALFDTLQQLPNGSYSPPAIAQAADPGTLPWGMLPAGLTERLAENTTGGAGREAAAADLDAALSGLSSTAGAAGGGGAS